MIELGPSARELAARFPKGHPERVALEGMASIAESWNLGRNGEKAVLPSAEQLIASEKETWRLFLGKEITTAQPPKELFEAWSRALEQGITSFEAHFLPKISFKQNSKFPGWHVKPEDWYWQNIKEGKLAKDAAKLPGIWVLVDGSQKPDYDNGKQLYASDGFSQILLGLRVEGKIDTPESYKHVPASSRFAVTPDERKAHFDKALASLIGVNSSCVRITREIEFNVLGNLYHPEWGQTSTLEWFADAFGDSRRLYGGHRDDGGLADVNCSWSDDRNDGIGFRPLVTFPSKS